MRRKFLVILCAMTMLLSQAPALGVEEGTENAAGMTGQAVPLSSSRVVLVGLAYGSGARPGANLANDTGSGYRFGYLDENRKLIPLGYTAETGISVVKTQNVSYGLDTALSSTLRNYSDNIRSDITVGCWHVTTDRSFDSFEACAAAASAEGGFPAWINGSYQVRYGCYTTREEAQAAAGTVAGGIVCGTSAYGVSVVKTGTAQILFQFDGAREDLPLAVVPGLDYAEGLATWYNGVRWYGGFVFRRTGGGNLSVINAVGMEDYVSCLLAQEMSPSWPIEALKAQAVCARNYVESERRGHTGFDVCSTTHCQAYPGITGENASTRRAAMETAGVRAWYNGKLVSTYYYSSSGGGSENVRNVWGSGSDIPYLVGVIDPYEETIKEMNAYWNDTKTFTASEIRSILNKSGYSCADVVDIRTDLTPTGNVKTLTIVDSSGKSWPFVREKGVRNMLGLRSMRYWVEKVGGSVPGVYHVDRDGTAPTLEGLFVIGGDGAVTALGAGPVYAATAGGTTQVQPPRSAAATGEVSFVFHTSGWGHSVGMSQFGAYAMALQGKTYADILTFYFPGIELSES